jgi:C4-dicarboxylate-specific signal transduction histidine kinase
MGIGPPILSHACEPCFRRLAQQKERLDINEATAEVVILTQSEVRRNTATLRMQLAADLPPVMGDRVQLQQVVINLILNSIEAMRTVENRGQNLVIKTQREGDEVRVSIRGSGSGFDPRSAQRMFDAFYTTKPGGLGIGLSISRSIVKSHGGRLWAESNDGPAQPFNLRF